MCIRDSHRPSTHRRVAVTPLSRHFTSVASSTRRTTVCAGGDMSAHPTAVYTASAGDDRHVQRSGTAPWRVGLNLCDTHVAFAWPAARKHGVIRKTGSICNAATGGSSHGQRKFELRFLRYARGPTNAETETRSSEYSALLLGTE